MPHPSSRSSDILLTALAPAIWGSTYLVTTRFLPEGIPFSVALLRALPAGLLLLVILRRLPPLALWGKLFVLGALNFTLFWSCLFIAAYRLPGGVAATLGAMQPLIVLILMRVWMGAALRPLAVFAGVAGVIGVALLVLTPAATLDPLGLIAALIGALSMAIGTVLTRTWALPATPLTVTAWQLVAGGLLLLPIALILDPPMPQVNATNLMGFVYLGLIGGAVTYFLWFRGIARLDPQTVAPLGLLSPFTAVILGVVIARENLSALQSLGMVVVLASVYPGQYAQAPRRMNPA
ncbi:MULTISPECIES: EamA family transporter [Roseobacteraceae]|uniref:EamA family transporter n=1 Tax=Roseobacteraceae TaxID=2854170 RepID=UPI00125EF616|nr:MULTISPECIES: EamA family transporter [Roseobacteraceae]KAB6715281.1 EamA family transporter [Roseobacter sp. TSBP12]